MQMARYTAQLLLTLLAMPYILHCTGSSNIGVESQALLRKVVRDVKGEEHMEGAGVKITRTVGTQKLRNLDPFLMLDELRLPARSAFAGFPDHPHRGFETCSIMLHGQMEHKDSAGNQGVIGPGGVQWMTAGRGIVHSEMPRSTSGLLWGFQLWVNLPARQKMCKPRYQDYQAADIPVAQLQAGLSVRVMAGSVGNVTGPIRLKVPGMLLDVRLEQGGHLQQPVAQGWNAFAYIYNGTGSLSGTTARRGHALVLGSGDHLTASTGSRDGLRFLLFAGQPIGEPIQQYGPFVMNSMEEIHKAYADYQSGKLQNPDDDPWVDEHQDL